MNVSASDADSLFGVSKSHQVSVHAAATAGATSSAAFKSPSVPKPANYFISCNAAQVAGCITQQLHIAMAKAVCLHALCHVCSTFV